MIGHFSGRTLLHGPLKLKFFFVAKLLRDLSPNFCQLMKRITVLKLSITLNCVLKRANDLENNFKLTLLAFDLVPKFEAALHEWKSFPNSSGTQ